MMSRRERRAWRAERYGGCSVQNMHFILSLGFGVLWRTLHWAVKERPKTGLANCQEAKFNLAKQRKSNQLLCITPASNKSRQPTIEPIAMIDCQSYFALVEGEFRHLRRHADQAYRGLSLVGRL